MLKRVSQFIEREHLFEPSAKILVGLSGGPDSTALLHILHTLGYECIAAHCNFHLRGDDSNRDAAFCRKLCDHLRVEMLEIDFETTQLIQKRESIEMCCRRLRYNWWAQIISSGKATNIAVGHHREDNIETLLINLFRGSGISGLKAMLPKRDKIVRPLLFLSRKEIIEYLDANHLEYVIDVTNAQCDYTRNKIRNVLLPEIQRLFPQALDGIANSIGHLRDNFNIYTDAVSRIRKEYMPDGINIDVSAIISQETFPAAVLFELIYPLGGNSTLASDIIDCQRKNESGKKFRLKYDTYSLNRGVLLRETIVTPPQTVSFSHITDIPLATEYMSNTLFQQRMHDRQLHPKGSLYVDYDLIRGEHVFELRPWRKGDRIRPYGLNGSKLVSDILTDSKVPEAMKSNVLVLSCDGSIIWVVGFRAGSSFPVSASTETVIQIMPCNTTE